MKDWFPLWHTSDVFVRDVSEKIDPYLYCDNMQDVTMSFIPRAAFYAVPEEDRKLFLKIYNVFAAWVMEKILLQKVFKQFIGTPICPHTFESMKYSVRNELCRIFKSNDYDLGQIFRSCYIAEEAHHLPDDLKEKLEEEL